MNHLEEMNYRNSIMERLFSGGRITQDERIWLATHRLINPQLGYPYLQSDVVAFEKNKLYTMRVKLVSSSYPGRILPVFSIPMGKGEILPAGDIFDLDENRKPAKPVKVLGCLLKECGGVYEFQFRSSLGFMAISFECEYFDKNHNLIIRKDSNSGDPNYSMVRINLTDNTVRYQCKAPTAPEYDSLVFDLNYELPD